MEIFVGIVFALAFILIIWLWLIAPQIKDRPNMTELKKYDYAHRGLHDNEKEIPENSLMSFRLAAERGFGIELDLQLTKDKVLVVHHDLSLKRLCDADVRICDLTLDELHSKYRLLGTDEKIPTFAEALQAVGKRVPLIIELKHYNPVKELCPAVYEMLKDYDGLFCIESFDPRIVQWFKTNAPEIIRGQLMEDLKSNSELSVIQKFLARNLCTNFLTRPNFEAYDYHTRSRPSMWIVKRFFAMTEVSWTVKDWKTYRTLKKQDCIIIFEGFEPNREYEQKRSRKPIEKPATVATLGNIKNKNPQE